MQEPPISVKGLGRLGIEEAITLHLTAVLARADDHDLEESGLIAGIPDVLSWITWQQLGQVVQEQKALFRSSDASVRGTVSRLAQAGTHAIARHS